VSRSAEDRLADARDHLRRLRQHAARGDLADDTILDAVCMRLSAAIECVAGIDENVRTQAFGTSWPAVWAVRNRITHGYAHLDRKIILATVNNDLPDFEAALERVADSLTD
jgi:uncharacterized protein with HEPN domain